MKLSTVVVLLLGVGVVLLLILVILLARLLFVVNKKVVTTLQSMKSLQEEEVKQVVQCLKRIPKQEVVRKEIVKEVIKSEPTEVGVVFCRRCGHSFPSNETTCPYCNEAR